MIYWYISQGGSKFLQTAVYIHIYTVIVYIYSSASCRRVMAILYDLNIDKRLGNESINYITIWLIVQFILSRFIFTLPMHVPYLQFLLANFELKYWKSYLISTLESSKNHFVVLDHLIVNLIKSAATVKALYQIFQMKT